MASIFQIHEKICSLKNSNTINLGIRLCLLAALTSIPFLFFFLSFPYAHDLPDHLAMSAQFYTSFSEGNIIPRWYGDFNLGWGEPTGIFYPPGLPGGSALLTWLLGGNHVIGLISALWLFTFIGSVGLYKLASDISSEKAAFIAIAIWILAPFRAFELYAAGLYSFYAAGCLLPWAMLLLVRLVHIQGPDKLQLIVAWSVVYALIILTNLPFGLMMTYLIAVWVIIDAVASKSIQGAFRIIIGAFIGLCLAALYILPSLLEISNIVIPHSESNPIYQSNFIFQSNGSWMPQGLKRIFNHMGIYQIMAFILGAIILLLLRSSSGHSTNTNRRSAYMLVGTFGLLSFTMATTFSAPLWHYLPLLHQVNLPWRFLEMMTIPLAVSLASAIELTLNKRSQTRLHDETVSNRLRAFILFAIAIVLAINVYQSFTIFQMNPHLGKSLNDVSSIDKIINSFYSRKSFFLPKGAKDPLLLSNHPRIKSLDQGAELKVIEWRSAERRIHIKAQHETKISLRTYYYPGWRAEYINNGNSTPVSVETDTDTGGILVTAPPGEGEIYIFFDTTHGRYVALILSSIALMVCCLILLSGFMRKLNKNFSLFTNQ